MADLGFDVVRVGRFGVSVNADDKRFETVFGVQVPQGTGLVHELHDPPESLRGLVDLLEVVPEPHYFARKAS